MMDDSTIKTGDNQPSTREVRVLFAGRQCVGLFADQIEAIADWRAPAPLPDAPASILGVASIRGRMLTVLAANVLLGQEAAAVPGKIVALRGDEQIALAVDRAGELVHVAAEDVKAPTEGNSLILGVIADGEQFIPLLDPKQLFTTAMRGRERRRRHF